MSIVIIIFPLIINFQLTVGMVSDFGQHLKVPKLDRQKDLANSPPFIAHVAFSLVQQLSFFSSSLRIRARPRPWSWCRAITINVITLIWHYVLKNKTNANTGYMLKMIAFTNDGHPAAISIEPCCYK